MLVALHAVAECQDFLRLLTGALEVTEEQKVIGYRSLY